ncbi:MAG: hypothetical protein WBA25_05210, partial [Jannaschia sp.]
MKNMKMSRFMGVVAAGVFSLAGAMASAATVDLGFGVDESGSINQSEFALIRDGLASALKLVPTSGDVEYRISVVY